ncbi:hypothetical protein PTT65_02555 [Serratia ureilytica]|uniref:hypothetical protein n=1 Tax=Serratia ureilytica TaxID=300181 RepID=UPI00224BA847|nr:hypothetical protein [Serratia ureilytica]
MQFRIRVNSARRLNHRLQLHAQRRIVLDRRYLLLFRAVANAGAAAIAIAGMAFIAAPRLRARTAFRTPVSPISFTTIIKSRHMLSSLFRFIFKMPIFSFNAD